MATRMLLNNGLPTHKSRPPATILKMTRCAEGRGGYALQERGVAASESWIGTGTPRTRGRQSAMVIAGTQSATDGGICYNDNMAAGALAALKITASPFPCICLSSRFSIEHPIARYTDPPVDYRALSYCNLWRKSRPSWRYGGCRHAGYRSDALPTLVRRHSVARGDRMRY